MSFKLCDIIVESVIRDGFEACRRYPETIDDVFESLTYSHAQKKYGQAEIEKIKKIVQEREVSIVHSFNLVSSNLPCLSIQLSDDRESENYAHMGNYRGLTTIPYMTPEQIASTIQVPAFTASSYDAITGTLHIPNSVNLSQVHTNLIIRDADAKEFTILGGIINEIDHKQVMIPVGSEPNITQPMDIRTILNYNQYRRNGNVEEVQLILGIHTKDALLTKYLYTLVKYFMISRKNDLINRGFQLNTYTGSDFTRDQNYPGDVVYTRFFQVSGLVQHSWRADKVRLLDNLDVTVTPIDGGA